MGADRVAHQSEGFSSQLPLVPLVRCDDVALQRVCVCLRAALALAKGFCPQPVTGLHLWRHGHHLGGGLKQTESKAMHNETHLRSLRVRGGARELLVKLEQLDQLRRSFGSFRYQLGVLVRVGGKLIRRLLGAEAVVFLPVL